MMSRALGRYELLRPLARGGMAEVYLARRRAAGVEKWLVVKRMRPERAGDARFLELFVREARLSMSLAHQNIVPVFDFGRIDDQVFIAMERIEGKDFGSSLVKAAKDRPIAPLLAAFVAAECCQALDYAHLRKGPDGIALGIVHRDVTPRNVLLSWSGEVKLTDFGIAALAGDDPSTGPHRHSAVLPVGHTRPSRVIGTPAYMAPEQARGEAVDRRADVYAVGMFLREALTGRRPRPGDEREATLAAARRGELVPWPDGVESQLVAIVDRATSLDPDARYPDARAMLEALDGFIVGERAAKKTDAPARALAAWLGEVWRDERDEPPIDETIAGSHLVSFLDDGALDVIGTGTERSMAATADEGPAPTPAPTPTPAPAPSPTPPPAPLATPQIARSPESPTLTPTRIAVVVAGVAIVGAIFFMRSGSSRPDPVPKPDPITNVKIDPPLPKSEPIARPDPPKHDQQPEPIVIPKIDPPVRHPETHRGSAAIMKPLPAVVAPALHSVQIGATPWAYFTIDDAAASHQTPERVALPVGVHVIHFSHPQLGTRDVPITVPDADTLKVVQDLRR